MKSSELSRQRLWQLRKKKLGLCPTCGANKPRENYVLCDVCLEKVNKHRLTLKSNLVKGSHAVGFKRGVRRKKSSSSKNGNPIPKVKT